MTLYYVLGITFVVFALIVTALGLTRDDFPPTPRAGRTVIIAGAVIAVVTFAVLVSSSHVEHPREEAAAEAAEKKEEAAGEQGGGGEAAKRAPQAGEKIAVVEKEYSIELPRTTFKAGDLTFDVRNEGKVPHDLAVEDGGNESKTPLIDGGGQESLVVDLKPGKYTLYCTVPGHEDLGMKKEVTVD
jgi:uncharacterized cupredoxin-like copper-binding protein